MFRNYITRIMSQVVRKLIYPELVEIRLEIEKIDVASEFKIKESIDSLKKGNIDIQSSIEEIGAKLSDDIFELRASIKKGDSGIDTLVQNIVHKELSELDSAAHKRDAKQSEKISDLRDMTEKSYERIHKRDAKQTEKISDLHNMIESCYEKLQSEITEHRQTEEALRIYREIAALAGFLEVLPAPPGVTGVTPFSGRGSGGTAVVR